MLKLFKRKKDRISLTVPCKGQLIPLEEVEDAMFAKKLLGDGFAVQPLDDVICAPCSGRITMIADSAHAFGITLNNGAEVLVHVGLDTVNLKGEGFTVMTQLHASVKKGTPVLKINRAFMKEKHLNLTIPVILINDEQHELQHHIYKGEADGNMNIVSIITR